jgi:hypothetical protein
MINCNYSANNEFNVTFNPISEPVLPWADQVTRTAERIRNSTNKDIVIAASGGIDAEVACRGFMAANIPFRMLISEWDDGLNNHDILHAYKFAEQYGIETITCKMDMKKFLTTDMYRYAAEGYKSHLPFRYFQIYLLEQIEKLNCTGIVCSGDMFLVSKGTDICVSYEQDYFLAEDWCRNNGLHHVPAFHLATPELTAAFLNHPVIQFVSSNYKYVQQKDKWINYNPEKIIMYHSEYRDMLGRRKLMGWERLWPEWGCEVRKMHSMWPTIASCDILLSDVRAQLGL